MKAQALIQLASALGMALLLSGCAGSGPKQLYSWNGYEDQVYSYLRNEGASSQQQILVLEKGLAESAVRHAALPPGYLAHLGLLYLGAGRTDDALRAWEGEKAAFPEAAPYIDYLIDNMKQKAS